MPNILSQFFVSHKQSKILVCKPKIPSNRVLNKLLAISRRSGYITNNGPLVQAFETELKNLLNISHISVTSSGTIALIIMLKALKLKYNRHEVITTPFSFVATSSAITAAGCTPVFADIEESSPFISPYHVSRNINQRTLCVLATHVYGFDSNSKHLEDICNSKQVPLVFDAAHAVGCSQGNRSLPSLGYASVISTHATKALSSAEGGAIASDDEDFINSCSMIRDFSYTKGSQIPADIEGVNGKQSELHAAVGLANIKSFAADIEKRKLVHSVITESLKYSKTLTSLEASLNINDNFRSNYLYYPIIPRLSNSNFDAEDCKQKFEDHKIFVRRYFYPSLDTLVVNSCCVNSRLMASKVICLPCHSSLSKSEINRISAYLKST